MVKRMEEKDISNEVEASMGFEDKAWNIMLVYSTKLNGISNQLELLNQQVTSLHKTLLKVNSRLGTIELFLVGIGLLVLLIWMFL